MPAFAGMTAVCSVTPRVLIREPDVAQDLLQRGDELREFILADVAEHAAGNARTSPARRR